MKIRNHVTSLHFGNSCTEQFFVLSLVEINFYYQTNLDFCCHQVATSKSHYFNIKRFFLCSGYATRILNTVLVPQNVTDGIVYICLFYSFLLITFIIYILHTSPSLCRILVHFLHYGRLNVCTKKA